MPGAAHIELGAIADRHTQLANDLVVHCGKGQRAMTAASLLERAGHTNVGVTSASAVELTPRHRLVGSMTATAGPIRLGIRANLAQFVLLVVVNALVGGMLGQERTVLPLLAREEFGLDGFTAAMTFILAFGLVKAMTNFLAGTLSDRWGRKPVLVAGWLFALPVPLLLIWAPSWSWVIAANVLLGINQGLTWSTTVIMKIDLAGPERRGLAMGLNEAAGYVAVSATALLTGFIAARAGLRPEPFYLGIAYAALGLGLSTLAVRETRNHAAHEATVSPMEPTGPDRELSVRKVMVRTSFTEPSLSAASQAGMVNNLNDGMAWGLLPLYFSTAGLSISPNRGPRGGLSRGMGLRPARHRSLVGSSRSQTPDCRRNVDPGCGHRRDRCRNQLLRVVGCDGAPGCRDRFGLSNFARRGWRSGSSALAGDGRRRLPLLARCRDLLSERSSRVWWLIL